ncbi:MAG TPA: threonine/serine exporter family protein [Opitutaceae bacterium]|nr:threonine/serine exporter family protein [Opitutaceae bacterium]
MTLFELTQDFVLAAIPAAGFGMLFNVPPRILIYCAVGGALGHGLRFALVHGPTIPIEWATLIAATAVSFLGVYLARRLRTHPKVFTVAAMIPMVPGVAAYTTVLAIVQINQKGFSEALWQTAVQNGLRTFFIVSALAVGLAAPGLLLYRRRPVV